MIVELNTPGGNTFSGSAGGVEMRTTDGAITLRPGEESYLNLTHATQVVLRIGTEFVTFEIENAAASFRDGRLTILAETIRRVEPAAG